MFKRLTTLLAALAIGALALPAAAQDTARIHLIHGIPGVDVDVEVDGAVVFPNFAFGDTQDLSSLAGTTLVGLTVKAAGTDTVAIDAGDIALPASGNYTVIAHLDASGTPTLAVFENDTSTLAAGEGLLTVRHVAAAPAVDVLANGAAAFTNLANPDEASAALPAGVISAEVVPTGATEPVVIGPADLSIQDGASLIVYAVGSLDDGSLTVLTESITGLGSAPTAVNTGTSPVAPNLAIVAAIGLALITMATVVTRRFALVRD